MNMLTALALVKNPETLARPISWRGTARGITWAEQRDETGAVIFELGWRQVGIKITEYNYRDMVKVSLPMPSELNEEWEVIDQNVIKTEQDAKDRSYVFVLKD